MDTLFQLLQETVAHYICPSASLTHIDIRPMQRYEQGWSGSELRRCHLTLSGHVPITLVTKTAALDERCALLRLSEQGHAHVPFAHTLDQSSSTRELLCMQDLASGPQRVPHPFPPLLDEQVAEGLASIHVTNLGQGQEMPWLRRADATFFQDHFLAGAFAVWHEMLQSNAAFAQEFRCYTPRLEQAGEQMVRDMTALYNEGTSLTLLHGDVHPVDGDHLLYVYGRPYFIDWGLTLYGSFYLDVYNYFDPLRIVLYHRELIRHGINIPVADFLERYHAVGRYIGFKYLCSGVWQWPEGPTPTTGKRLLQMLTLALHGSFPQRRFDYDDALFEQLVQAHQRSKEL